MKTKRLLIGLAIVACNLAIVSPMAVRALQKVNEYRADFRDSDTGFKQKTDEKTVDLEVGKSAQQARLRVTMRVPEGVVSFRLLDPDGKERLQGEVTSGQGSFDSKEMSAMEGVWKLHFKRHNASGKYDLHWRVR